MIVDDNVSRESGTGTWGRGGGGVEKRDNKASGDQRCVELAPRFMSHLSVAREFFERHLNREASLRSAGSLDACHLAGDWRSWLIPG